MEERQSHHSNAPGNSGYQSPPRRSSEAETLLSPDDLEKNGMLSNSNNNREQRSVAAFVAHRPRLMLAALALSILINFYLALATNSWAACPSSQTSRRSITGLAERPPVARKDGFWAPEYDLMLSSEADIDARWKAASGGYGVVALDSRWAAEQGLEPSIVWPLDKSKQAYVLTAYHTMHCVVSFCCLPPELWYRELQY